MKIKNLLTGAFSVRFDFSMSSVTSSFAQNFSYIPSTWPSEGHTLGDLHPEHPTSA